MRTFLCRHFNRPEPRALQFMVDGQPVTVRHTAHAVCLRCKKPIGNRGAWPVITMTKSIRKHMLFSFYGQLHTHYRVSLYHARCVPPNVFKAAPGSRPGPGRSRVAPVNVSSSPPSAARSGVDGPAIVDDLHDMRAASVRLTPLGWTDTKYPLVGLK